MKRRSFPWGITITIGIAILCLISYALVLAFRDISPKPITKEDQRATFWNAMIVGDTAQIEKSVSEAPWLLQEQRNSGIYPIHDAIMKANPSLVQLFIDHGASVKVCSTSGASCMEYCAMSVSAGHPKTRIKNAIKIAEILLENGADINITSDGGSSPLFQAKLGECTELVEFLEARGAKDR